MKAQVLSLEQVMELREKEGMDISTSSFCWCRYEGEEVGTFSHLLPNDEEVFERCLVVEYMPTLTFLECVQLSPYVLVFLNDYMRGMRDRHEEVWKDNERLMGMVFDVVRELWRMGKIK